MRLTWIMHLQNKEMNHMPDKDSVTEIFIIAIVFAWPVMSIIYYLFIFVKAFVRSFNRIDTTQQSPLSSPEMELKNEQPDNELKNNFSLERFFKAHIFGFTYEETYFDSRNGGRSCRMQFGG